MAVFRVERNSNYTTMSNYHLRDRGLSLKAKGLLSMFLSLPDEWHYSISGLMRITKEGRESLTTAVRELEKAGYLTRRQERQENGKIVGIEYIIFEKPQSDVKEDDGIQRVQYGDGATDRYAAKPESCGELDRADDEPCTDPGLGPAGQSVDNGGAAGMPVDSEHAGSPLTEKPLTEKPLTEKPLTGKPLTENPLTGKPLTGNPLTGKPLTGHPPAGNPAGIIINQLNTDKSNTDGINKRVGDSVPRPGRYGPYENVLLTDTDLEKLKREFPQDYERRIERLSEYMVSTGKKYRNHLATIRSWARRDAEKQAKETTYSHDRYRYREGESL